MKRPGPTIPRRRTWGLVVLALVLALTGCAGDPDRGTTPPTATRPAASAEVVVSPYLYLGGESPPDPATVMAQTNVRWFTLAFVLSTGACAPAWSGQDGLGAQAAGAIGKVHRAGGHLVVSMGGARGDKLGVRCHDARSLAAAYQEVIDRYHPEGLDLDVEGAEFDGPAVQDRILRALTIVRNGNPRLTISVTLPVTPDGLDQRGRRLVRRAAELHAPVDVWMIMPFNFGQGGGDMGRLAVRATERTHDLLGSVHPDESDRALYRRQGIVLMNGRTDTEETVTPGDFRQVREYAERHQLARVSFWSLNRDRACRGQEGHHTCSGVRQRTWEFAGILEPGPPQHSGGQESD